MSSNDYGESVSPVQRAWENGGRQFYLERKRQEEMRAREQAEREMRAREQAAPAWHADLCTPARGARATSSGYTLREQNYLQRTGQLPAYPSQGLTEKQPPVIVYAQYDPQFDPDLHPLPPVPAAKPKVAKPVKAAPAAQPVQPAPEVDPDCELPPGMTPAEWLAHRHVVSVARKVVADPVNTSYVPVQAEEEPQLVVTPAGFRYTGRFEHLEIRR